MSVSVKRTLALEIARQRPAFDELHRDVGHVLGAAEVVDGDDAGMVQPAGGLGLVAESRGRRAGAVVVGVELGADRLQRDGALDVGVEPLVDDTHRAFTENLGDAVFAKLRRVFLVGHALK
jgi:hypothetical protein